MTYRALLPRPYGPSALEPPWEPPPPPLCDKCEQFVYETWTENHHICAKCGDAMEQARLRFDDHVIDAINALGAALDEHNDCPSGTIPEPLIMAMDDLHDRLNRWSDEEV